MISTDKFADLFLQVGICLSFFLCRFDGDSDDYTGRSWRSGSFAPMEDLPMKGLSQMFNVNHYLVSQTNPHVAPVLHLKQRANHKLVQIVETEWQLRSASSCLVWTKCSSCSSYSSDFLFLLRHVAVWPKTNNIWCDTWALSDQYCVLFSNVGSLLKKKPLRTTWSMHSNPLKCEDLIGIHANVGLHTADFWIWRKDEWSMSM